MADYAPSTDHPLLSTEAAARLADPDTLAAYADAAEALLDIRGAAYSGDDAALATSAVALQINALVVHDPQAAFLKSQGRGARSQQYLAGAPVHPTARAIVAKLAQDTGEGGSGAYAVFGSHRRG